MKISNRFKEEDKHRVWQYHQFCILCGSNQQCSLHHIYGCKEKHTDSICNSSMLCNEHHKEADGYNTGSPKSEEYRQMLLKKTMRLIVREGYQINENDHYFLQGKI